jgi:glutamate/tyrosine decarboxylase-like PLP-dependent enzyme
MSTMEDADLAPYAEALRCAYDESLAYLNESETGKVGATASLEELRERFDVDLPQSSSPPSEVVDQLVAKVEGGLHRSTSGRFFGWVIGGAVPASLAADWLTSTWDQNAGMFTVAPAAAVVEEVCGKWLIDLLGLPARSSFALVTGCQMAHATCLSAARNELLARAGWDVEKQGLYGAPRIRIVTGDQRHGTILRALQLLGMGTDCVVDLAVESDGRLSPESLEKALAQEPDTPTILMLRAGDLNTGCFDSFEELIPIAHRHSAWVHVDGAFGMWAQQSPEHKHLLKGIEDADSWATDGHKWLNVPYDSGYAFVKNSDAHFRAFSHKAAYLKHTGTARDQVDWNPEHSRRARGFPTYAAIASLGREGISKIVTEACRHAKAIVEGAGEMDGVEILATPIINQGLIRFLDPSPERDHDRYTDWVTDQVVASGEAFFACTTWKGMRCMRVSVSSWRTSESDVARVLKSIGESLA